MLRSIFLFWCMTPMRCIWPTGVGTPKATSFIPRSFLLRLAYYWVFVPYVKRFPCSADQANGQSHPQAYSQPVLDRPAVQITSLFKPFIKLGRPDTPRC